MLLYPASKIDLPDCIEANQGNWQRSEDIDPPLCFGSVIAAWSLYATCHSRFQHDKDVQQAHGAAHLWSDDLL